MQLFAHFIGGLTELPLKVITKMTNDLPLFYMDGITSLGPNADAGLANPRLC